MPKNADLVVSLHCNAHSDAALNGVEAYYNDKNAFKEKSHAYSKILLENQMELFSTNHGMKTARMYILKNIKSPGLLLELGFLTNEKDKAILTNTEHQKDIAASIFDGLEEIRTIN